MLAYANPTRENQNASGYGIVRFDKPNRKVIVECWPRGCDVTDPETQQFPGWPLTFSQSDNYGRKALALLPTINTKGGTDAVIQIIDEYLDEVVYTVRMKGSRTQPKVFREAKYTIRVTVDGETKELRSVEATPFDKGNPAQLTFEF